MRQISLAVLLAIFAFSTVCDGQKPVVSTATHQSATQLVNSRTVFLPSPFTSNVGDSSVKFAGSSNNVVDVGNALLASNSNSSSKKIIIEVRTLIADLETSNKVLNIVGSQKFTYSSGEIKPTWKPQQENVDPNEEFASGQTATIQSHPISHAQITDEQFSEIVSLLKSSPRSRMTQAPTVATYENEPAKIADAASVPFVVAVKPIVGETSVAMEPEIQLIEEGTIYEFIAGVTDNGIQLNTHLIWNQITDVDTFTFDGSGNDEAVTIQLPTCKCTQVHLATEIKHGYSMLIDSNHVQDFEVRKKPGVLNRIVGNEKIEKYKTKTMILIRTSVVEE